MPINVIASLIAKFSSSELFEVIQTHPSYNINFEYNISLVIGSLMFTLNFKFQANSNYLFDLPENFTILSYSDQPPAITSQPQRLQFMIKHPAQCSND